VRVLFASFLTLASGACGLLYPADDYDSGGAADGGRGDETKPTKTDGAEDDGGTRFERPCEGSSALIFCDDFDDGALGAKWTELLGTGHDFDGAAFVSSPRSIVSRVEGGGSVTAQLRKTWTTPHKRIECEVAIRPDSPRGKPVTLMALEAVMAGTRVTASLTYAVSATAFDVTAQSSGDAAAVAPIGNAIPALPDGVFTRVGIRMEADGRIDIRGSFDGATVFVTKLLDRVSGDGEAQVSSATLTIGPSGGEGSAWRALYDNVVCTDD